MDVLDWIFPQSCVACGRSGKCLCGSCLEKFQLIDPICPTCGRQSTDGVTHQKCRQLLGLDGLFVVWAYEGTVRESIKQLKFRFVKELARDLTTGAIGYLRSEHEFRKFLESDPIWIGVPLFTIRERWRGFNQADLLASLLAKELNGRFESGVIKRSRFTPQQVGLRGIERRGNMKGAFSVSSDLKNKTFVLVDDVWTTGATMKEAAKALKSAGAEAVWGFALAR